MGYFAPSMAASMSHASQAGIPLTQMAGPSTTTQDELAFFERVKKYLETRETYDEFLKLLSMYSKGIIDAKQLVTHAEPFLAGGELMAQFKLLLNWDDKQDSVEYGPPGSVRTGPPEPILPRATDDGEGPSYRKLPESVSILFFRH